MPYNPGITDISGQLRAQGLVAGSQAFSQGLQQGIAKWEQNKQEEKQMRGVIKSAETMAKGFGAIMESLDPRFAKALEEFQTFASDPNKSVREQATAAGHLLQVMPGLVNSGLNATQLKQQEMVRTAEIQQRAAEEARMRALNDEIRRRALGEPPTVGLPPDLDREASVGAAELIKKTQRTERDVDENNNPVLRTVTMGRPDSVSPINQQPRPVLSVDEEVDKLDKTEVAKAGWAMYNAVSSKLPEHYATLDLSADARSLIKSGVKQGLGAELKLNVMKLVNTLAPGTFDTTKEESAQRTYADMAVGAAARLKGQGQVTENERKMVAETVAKFGNTPEGALKIMDFMDAVARREIAFAEYLEEEREAGRQPRDSMRKKFLRENPLEGYMERDAPQAAKAGAAGGLTWDPATQSLK
jgi:hypothetical protein